MSYGPTNIASVDSKLNKSIHSATLYIATFGQEKISFKNSSVSSSFQSSGI